MGGPRGGGFLGIGGVCTPERQYEHLLSSFSRNSNKRAVKPNSVGLFVAGGNVSASFRLRFTEQ